MKYAVLVKQVPDVSQMQFDPETRRIRREGVRLEVSAFDIRALLRAIDLKAETGGEVVVITMGPPQAREALIHCLALGADRGIHLCDTAFAGADTLATARALAHALRKEGFDLVLCGRSSVDAETGQVGPEIAEILDIPQITSVRKLEVDPRRGRVKAERETDSGFEAVECQTPALISAAEDLTHERFPKRADKEAAKAKPITEWTAKDLADDTSVFGASGSPTWVEGIRIVENPRAGTVIAGEVDEAVVKLAQALAERGLLEEGTEKAPPIAPPSADRPQGDAIWVVAETAGASLRRVTIELLGKAVELAAARNVEAVAVLLGHGVHGHAETLAAHGADRVLVCDDPLLSDYSTDAFASVLTDAIRARRPRAVLLPSTWVGRDLAPRVAARLDLGLTGDAIDLEYDEQGRLVQWKPAFGGNVVAPILTKTLPEMATVRPGMLTPLATNPERRLVVEELRFPNPPAIRTLVTEKLTVPGADQAAGLDDCRVSIGVGKGVGSAEKIADLAALGDVLGGAVLSATRDVTDLGWLPRQHQVGLTGRAISPRLFIAVGIRGAFEHTVGLRKAGTIVAINKNPKALMFAQSDLGIVADWTVAVPLLVKAIRDLKQA